MLIPHMEKSPAVDAYTLAMLGDHICCGEVGSIKKFVYYQKDDTMPTPVYFSDFRPVEDVAFPQSRYLTGADESAGGSVGGQRAVVGLGQGESVAEDVRRLQRRWDSIQYRAARAVLQDLRRDRRRSRFTMPG